MDKQGNKIEKKWYRKGKYSIRRFYGTQSLKGTTENGDFVYEIFEDYELHPRSPLKKTTGFVGGIDDCRTEILRLLSDGA